jgi:hypothetical protein
VPVLRREFDALRPAHVPEAPTHESLMAAARAAVEQAPDATGIGDVAGLADTVTAGTGA